MPAHEVLGDETPDSLLTKRYAEKSLKESNLMTERRWLDFSECGSPSKGAEGARPSTSSSFSSPSSYLLNGCRISQVDLKFPPKPVISASAKDLISQVSHISIFLSLPYREYQYNADACEGDIKATATTQAA